VSIGVSIGGKMLHKLRRDLIAGMNEASHEGERVHTLDPSVTDVKTPQRHVRTRLYFTSESHIHSLFNVLRWGSEVTESAKSIFSDVARAKFDEMEVGYLTHIVFRVLHRKRDTSSRLSDDNAAATKRDSPRLQYMDPSSKSSYTVQVLVSPGVSHHDAVFGAEEDKVEQMLSSSEAIRNTEHMILSSRDDLTLEEVDSFFSHFVGDGEDALRMWGEPEQSS